MSKILVIGSANMDITYHVPHIPAPGETIIATSVSMNPGGKGANQAVAAARLGGDVAFLGRVGNDANGEALKRSMEAAGVDISGIITDENKPTGSAVILVSDDGQNSITVDPGCNAEMSAQDIWDHQAMLNDADYIVMQFEIGMEAIQAAKTMAGMLDKRVILNPAPMLNIGPEFVQGAYVLVPNETEADTLFRGYTNDQLPVLAASYGVDSIIVTLGPKGAVLAENGTSVRIPTVKVKAVDTTGAGDCFVGALAVALSEGSELPDAVTFANSAASISVTRHGAQCSMPARDEVE